MASLLGQFFSRIKGSQEDIASEGIVYILESSKSARDAINIFIYNNTGINLNNINYISQSVGENKERPDISGIDENGNEVIIIEAKFWASLTGNQPNEYLKRLKENSVLLFVCPKLRAISLASEIETRLKNDKITYEYTQNRYIIDKKHIFITDWSTILETIKTALANNNERVLVSDVDQIIGFCEIIDNNTFPPIMDHDLSPAIAKRINSYCDLLDKIIDKLKISLKADITGLKATGQKYGYTRYFRIGSYGFSLDLNLKMWELFADTPFWITVQMGKKGGPWDQPENLKSTLKNISQKLNIRLFKHTSNNYVYFSIAPKIGEVEEKVIEGFENTIKNILVELEQDS